MSEFPHVTEQLRNANRAVLEQGGKYAIALVPSKLAVLHQFCEWPPDSALAEEELARSAVAEALRDFCATEEVPFLDLTPALRASAANGELPFFAADTHLNAHGHAVMCDALAPWLRRLLQE